MAPVPDPHPPPSSTGGTYDVNESGIEFRHVPGGPPTPRDGTEFLSRLASSLKLNVLDRPSKDELVFELLGVDVSFANALRRIMISEVPTMALEQVYMWNNTCLIHDEVLSHRLGLVPLNVDPRLFDEYGEDVDEDGAHAATDRNTVVFKLDVTCGTDKADDERTRTRTEAKLRGEGMVSGYDVAEAQRRGGGQSGGRTTTDDDDDDDEGGGGGIVGIVGIDDAEPSVANLSLADTAASAAVDAPGVAAAATRTPIDPPHRPFTRHVYARDLLWAPQGDQLSRFPLHSSGVGSGVGGGDTPDTRGHTVGETPSRTGHRARGPRPQGGGERSRQVQSRRDRELPSHAARRDIEARVRRPRRGARELVRAGRLPVRPDDGGRTPRESRGVESVRVHNVAELYAQSDIEGERADDARAGSFHIHDRERGDDGAGGHRRRGLEDIEGEVREGQRPRGRRVTHGRIR